MASLLFHMESLKIQLAATDALMSTYMFRDSTISLLRDKIIIDDLPRMKGSEISYSFIQKTETNTEAIHTLPGVLNAGISQFLDDKDVDSSNITRDVLIR